MTDDSYINQEVPWPDFAAEAPRDIPGGGLPVGSSVMSGGESPVVPTDPLEVLRQYWGYPSFRGIQEQIVRSVLAGHDTLGLMPTGGGKSVTFQVPALILGGACLVVTPLVALMKDQVAHLRQRGIRATCIHSGLTHDQIVREFDNCVLGHYPFLYVSPERLSSPLFLEKLPRLHVRLIAVDEAHCISQWGYDFRPAYLTLRDLRRRLPGVPCLALTATATPDVVTDIRRQLDFGPDGQTFSMSFDRPNLHYRVEHTEAKLEGLIHTLATTQGSAIVYSRSRNGTRDLALTLQQCGITASYYHAGLSSAEKDVRQQMWQRGDARVMVATNAFGMGIDKADVRLVLHLDPPDSLEAYFQEAGRAGRDGKPAEAILYANDSDKRLMLKRVAQQFPPKEKVRDIYDDLACYFQLAVGDGIGVRYELNLDDFCRRYHHFPITVEAALAILQRAGYLLYNGDDNTQSRVMFIVRRDDLYDFRINTLLGDRLVQAILRNYEGLFSTYVPIDEAFLAKECETTEDEVYESLLGLTRRRILHYIPRQHRPSIVYQQRRVEHSRVSLSEEAYERRLEQYVRRLAAVSDYIDDDFTPRSHQLLAYFGQEPPKDTASADNVASSRGALAQSTQDGAESDAAADGPAPTPRVALLTLLGDGALHHPTALHALPFPIDDINDAVLDLIDEGRVTVEDGHFRLLGI